jgi:hypothetical protein
VPRFVVIVVTLFVLPVSVAQAAHRTDGSTPAPAQIDGLVTNVPVSTLNQVGVGEIDGPASFNIFKLHGRLERQGKPELVTMNLAWCPHCAANSWGLAIALSRFGTLAGLRVLDSGTFYCTVVSDPCTLAPSPCFPHIHGLSFFSATYSSPYLSFDPIVIQDVHGHNLQSPTKKEGMALNSFDRQGQTPAVDVGGDYGFVSSSFSPGILAGKSWSQIAGSLAHPRNPIARRVDGLANLLTAAICKVTRGRPAGVCRSRGPLTASARLARAAQIR